jgi:hypothetical protein
VSPEEVAAMAAVTVALQQRAAAAAASAAAADARDAEHLNAWVDASRRAAQRAHRQRGPWRLSGRIPRRSRI